MLTDSFSSAISGAVIMEQANCPHCLARVLVEFDERCPGCGADLRDAFSKSAGETERAFGEAPFIQPKPAPLESTNPYQSPSYYPEKDEGYYERPPPQGLLWILFSFNGRIPRRTYWGASILTTLAFYAGIFAVVSLFGEDSEPSALIMLMLYIPYIWASLAIAVKRWHDRDKSGWWILIGMIPVIGPIWQFIETGCLRGTVGRNQYGPDPT